MSDRQPTLLTPITFDGLDVPNRMWLAPMCQYSVTAEDGVPNQWHAVHLGARAQGGFGMIVTEATATCPAGRISPQDTGLWSDQQAAAWAPIVQFCQQQGAKVAVQLAHAGRKASTYASLPRYADCAGSVDIADGGWQTVGPTTGAYPGLAAPRALTTDDIAEIIQQFADAAVRAQQAGFDAVQVHAAHGYLIHQFISPLTNDRGDDYGGSPEGRMLLLLQVVQAVREATGGTMPVGVRVSASDWRDGGIDPQNLAEWLRPIVAAGASWIDVSTGGLVPADIPVKPGYQVDHARIIKEATGAVTSAVGLITEPKHAEDILTSNCADAISLGRAALREPNWPWRAAAELNSTVDITPAPYWRAAWHKP